MLVSYTTSSKYAKTGSDLLSSACTKNVNVTYCMEAIDFLSCQDFLEVFAYDNYTLMQIASIKRCFWVCGIAGVRWI